MAVFYFVAVIAINGKTFCKQHSLNLNRFCSSKKKCAVCWILHDEFCCSTFAAAGTFLPGSQFYGLETGSQMSYCSCSALGNIFITLNQQNTRTYSLGVCKRNFPKYCGPEGSIIGIRQM